jgi:hypothetical protein
MFLISWRGYWQLSSNSQRINARLQEIVMVSPGRSESISGENNTTLPDGSSGKRIPPSSPSGDKSPSSKRSKVSDRRLYFLFTIWSFSFEIFRAILGISVFVSVGRWQRRFYR